jgi:hypothetical protein
MNKKRGLIFVVLLLALAMSLSVEGSCNSNEIQCNNGHCLKTNNHYDNTCTVSTSQIINITVGNFSAEIFEVIGTQSNKVFLQFINSQASLAENGIDGQKSGNLNCEYGEGGVSDYDNADGGKGGDPKSCSGCKGGAGAGGGAGGNILEKGGNGGRGGRVCGNCGGGCDMGGSIGPSGLYAGSNITIKADEIKIIYAEIINIGADGGDGGDGGEQNNRGQGGGGGAGGAGGGIVKLRAMQSINLEDGMIDVSGGNGGKAGNGKTAGVGNDEAGDGGGGGGGAPGKIYLISNGDITQSNFEFKLDGGDGGETRGGHGSNNAQPGQTPSNNQIYNLESKEWNPYDLNPIQEIYYATYYCSNDQDDDGDELFDMDDLDCYNEGKEMFKWNSKKGNTFSLYNESAKNVNDLMCGDDAFRCVAKDDPENQEQCNSYLFETQCDYYDYCTWQDSDLGGILNLQDNQYICIPNITIDNPSSLYPNYQGTWQFFSSTDEKVYNISIKKSVGSNPSLIYQVLSKDSAWFTCDAFNTQYFTSVHGIDNVLKQYEFPSSEDAEVYYTDLNFICAGKNFYKSNETDNSSVTNIQSLFHKCDEARNSLYEINSAKSSQLISSGDYRYQISLGVENITNFNNVNELTFFLNTSSENSVLNKISFFNIDENLGIVLVNKSQDFSSNNMTKYSVNLTNINENLNNVTRLFLNFNEVETTISLSNIALTFMNQNYYCGQKTPSGDNEFAWINDLDNSTYGEKACNIQPSYNWTGNYCCGDDTKFGEYELYNDVQGACFMGIPVLNNNLVYDMSGKEEHKSFLYNGTSLIGCNISVDNYLDGIYSDLTKLNATGGTNLISLQNSTDDICNVNSNYVCGINNEWINRLANGTEGNLYHNLDTSENFSLAYSPSFDSKQCCPGNSCWNGTSCVAHNTFLLDEKAVCINGNWLPEESSRKYNPLRDAYGHCPSDMCYYNNSELNTINLNGNNIDMISYENISFDSKNQNGVCVSSHYYVDDAYCLDGTWRSRPQLIASTFLDFVNNESNDVSSYTLLCDNQTSALNKSNNILLGNNNACVLSYIEQNKEKRLVGVSGNVSEILKSDEIKNENICDSVLSCTEDCNQFEYCGVTSDEISVYLNPHMNSLIIQRYENVRLPFWQTIINIIMDPINTIMRLLRGPDKPISFGKIGEVMLPDDLYDTFYIAQNDNKKIFGYVRNYNDLSDGTPLSNYIFVDYQNFTENICMKLYPLVFQESFSVNFRFFCEPYVNGSTTGFKIRTEKEGFDTSFKENLFNDLTSEIRINQGKTEEFIYLEFNQTPIKNQNFTVTLKNSSAELVISNGGWKLYSRQELSGNWNLGYGSCSLESDKLNCKISDLTRDYKLIVNHNNIKVEHIFNVVEHDGSEMSCNILPSNPYEGDILFANFTYNGFEEIEIKWYNDSIEIASCANQTYCNVFEHNAYTRDSNFNFSIKEKDSGDEICSSTSVNFSYCGDNQKNGLEQCDNSSNSNCTSSCTWKPFNCNGNFMLPCEAYVNGTCPSGCSDGSTGVCEGTPYCCDENTCDGNCNVGCSRGGLECFGITSDSITIHYWYYHGFPITINALLTRNDTLINTSSGSSGFTTYIDYDLNSFTSYEYELVLSGGFSKGIQCETLSESVQNELLVGGFHTVNQCGAFGGQVDVIPDQGNICKFTASSCPSGWVQYENWSTTLTTCGGPNSCDCGCCDSEVIVGYGWGNAHIFPPLTEYYDSGYCNSPSWSGGTCTCTSYNCWSFPNTCHPITTQIGCI